MQTCSKCNATSPDDAMNLRFLQRQSKRILRHKRGSQAHASQPAHPVHPGFSGR